MKQCKLFIQNILIGIFYSIKLLFAKLVCTKTSVCRAKCFSLFCQYCRVIPVFSVWYFLLSVICVIVTQLKLQIYSKSYLQLKKKKKSAIQSSSSIQFLFFYSKSYLQLEEYPSQTYNCSESQQYSWKDNRRIQEAIMIQTAVLDNYDL